MDAGLPLILLLVLNRHNYSRIAGLCGSWRTRWVPCASASSDVYPLGRARERWDDLALSIEEMMEAIRAIKVPEGLGLMQSWHPNDGNCCYQLSAVNAVGDSIGCSYLREFVNYGNVRDMPFMETWNHCAVAAGSGPATSRADLLDMPIDPRIAQSVLSIRPIFAFTGEWDAEDPFCETTNQPGSIFVSFQKTPLSGRLSKKPDLRIRDIP